MTKNRLPLALIALLFAYFCYINYLTPSHSDDFRYAPFGLGWDNHVHQYLRWSGRVVADYISPALLAIPFKPLLALLQTLGLFALVYLVYQIPKNAPFLQENQGAKPWVFLILLSLYTLSVPSFGQTNLWVVGSANYLWTTLLCTFYIYLFLGGIKNQKLPFYAYPLALLAGCTNEAAAAIIGLFSALAWMAYAIKSKKINLALGAYVVLFIIGAAILIAAPGNAMRLHEAEFGQWSHSSIFEKIIDHFLGKKFWNAIASSLLVYLPLIAYFLVLLKRTKGHTSAKANTASAHRAAPTQPPTAKDCACATCLCRFAQAIGRENQYSLFFFFLALSSSAIMAFSPVYPLRAMITAFIFCLIAIAFVLQSGYFRPATLQKLGLVLTAITFVCLLSITPRYQSLHLQERYINALIEASTGPEATLPSFFQRWTPFKDFRIDGYMNKADMAHYYHKEKITVVDPHFDFSVLLDAPTQIVAHAGQDVALYFYPYVDRLQFYKKLVIDQKNLDPSRPIHARLTYDDQSSETIKDFRSIALGDGFWVAQVKSSPLKTITRVELTDQ